MGIFKTVAKLFTIKRKYKCSARIQKLAKPLERNKTPKYVEPKFVPRSIKHKFKLFDFKTHTSKRIRKLAYPKLTYLVDNRVLFGNVLPKRNRKFLDKKIKKGLKRHHKLLKNSKVKSKRPKGGFFAFLKPKKRKRWSKRQWARHNKWLASRAKPKPDLRNVDDPDRGRKVPITSMVRFPKLARPRFVLEEIFDNPYMDDEKILHYVKVTALYYKTSDNIRNLARPKEYEYEDPESFFRVKKSALKGKIKNPDHIVEISKPIVLGPGEYILDKGNFAELGKVRKNALKYKISKRIQKISEPKPQQPQEDFEDAFRVKATALKGKCLPRTLELAKPREIIKP